jgi:putative ATPase
VEADRVSSIILYGPPGTGKTALARVIARRTRASFEWLNAATIGLEDLRRVLRRARADRRKGIKTILFLDEIHRFNKLQQDALLPDVEEGVLTLIAATVENPFFYVNSALLSRSQVFELKPLQREEILAVLGRALSDTERGLGGMSLSVDDDALEHIARMSDGDARKALSALEIAVLTTPAGERITREIAEESIQKKAVVYDKKGDQHYDTISAFIKSMRGSDPDATVYYLAKMLHAGEDPRFLARRVIICASEDASSSALPRTWETATPWPSWWRRPPCGRWSSWECRRRAFRWRRPHSTWRVRPRATPRTGPSRRPWRTWHGRRPWGCRTT